ncbi:MAG: flavodoxin family protein [bacterium]
MLVLGIYASPRQGGNTDLLLDRAMEGAEAAGAELERIYARKLDMQGCRECGGCDKTGECIWKDDMQKAYPLLYKADAIILSTPVFFYGVPAQGKALIDRAQAAWSKRMLEKKTREERKRYDGGKGYLIAAGATKGGNLFLGIELTARYFYDALDMSYEGGIFFWRVEGKGQIKDRPEAMEQAFRLGEKAARGEPAEKSA